MDYFQTGSDLNLVLLVWQLNSIVTILSKKNTSRKSDHKTALGAGYFASLGDHVAKIHGSYKPG